MFDHLDDPTPFTTDDDLRVAVARRGQRLQGRARLRAGLVSLTATLLLFALAIGGYARWQVSRIDRVSIAAIPQVDAQGNPVAPNVGALDKPFTMLVIGNDDAPDIPGRESTNHTDSIMLVRVDKPAGTVRVVSIPRDTLVTYEDGTEDRINVAREHGIPELITTINRTFGVTVDHYAEAHFDSFSRVVDAIGGVTLAVDHPMKDVNTGLDLRVGCQTLDGTQALALARSRHLQVEDSNGRWIEDPRSDLGRIDRQQLLGIAAAKQAAHRSLNGSLGNLDALVGTDPSQITLDDHLGVHDLLDLAGWVGQLPDSSIGLTVPQEHGTTRPNGASVLVLDAGAPEHVRSFLLDGSPSGPPATGTGTGTSTSAGAGAGTSTTAVPSTSQGTASQPIRVPADGECR